MSNPTSNFGWQMPTPTDLVTDLPADFEVFGQAVDSSMADLKGGTTGQILSKATNTDMDFVWIANDQGDITGVTAGTGISGGGTSGTVTITNSMATEITAKGDLIVGTGSATFDNLAAGSNGQTLVADSSTSTGLRYNPTTGNQNYVINGGFDIWQRGTTFTGPGTGVYLADRWLVQNSGVSPVITQQSTGAPNGSRYVFRATSGGTGSYTNIATMLETSNAERLWGQTATLQVKLRRNASFATTITAYLQKSATVDAGNGATWTTISSVTVSNANLPTGTGVTDWFNASVSGSVPNDGTANSLRVLVAPDATFGSGTYWEMAQVKLEAGSVATTFTCSAGTIQGELAACQRYLPSVYLASCIGYAYATNAAVYSANFPVPARVNPTGVTLSGSTNTAYALNTGYTVTPTFNSASVNMAQILVSSGLTIIAGQGSRLDAPTLLFTGCEL